MEMVVHIVNFLIILLWMILRCTFLMLCALMRGSMLLDLLTLCDSLFMVIFDYCFLGSVGITRMSFVRILAVSMIVSMFGCKVGCCFFGICHVFSVGIVLFIVMLPHNLRLRICPYWNLHHLLLLQHVLVLLFSQIYPQIFKLDQKSRHI